MSDTRSAVRDYVRAIHDGNWADHVSESFTTFISGNLDEAMEGKVAYVKGAGGFFAQTRSVDVRSLVVEGEQAAMVARYEMAFPGEQPVYCDVAEFLTFTDGLLTSSAIFFDTAAFAEAMSSVRASSK